MSRPKKRRWTQRKRERLAQAKAALDNLREYWPLTLRQVYYQLVANLSIENGKSAYNALSKLLKDARFDGFVPWEAIEDRARQHLSAEGWEHAGAFVRHERRYLLTGYRRDLLQSQSKAIEVWVEKDALSRVCQRAADPYCVPVVVARGFSSVSYLHECRQRVHRALQEGKDGLIVLYFGDLDPSGWEMPQSMERTLHEEMGLEEVVMVKRCALMPEQVSEYRLPTSLDAIKEKDTRTPKYRRWLWENGHAPTLAVELDAVPPDLLQTLVREAIESELNLDLFHEEEAKEEEEESRITVLRQRASTVLARMEEDLRGE